MASMTTIPPAEGAEAQQSWWQTLRSAVRGTHHDFTNGSLTRAIVLLATPMVLEMVMESLFAIVNVFWVTRLGSEAIATVGLTESMLSLVFSVAIGVSMSATAMVARRIGEKNLAAAAVAGAQGILLGAGIAILLGIPAGYYAPDLLRLMGGNAALVASGRGYASIVLGGNIVVMLLFLNNGIFRGAGDAYLAMRVLWIANALNLLLDPCLIFGLGPFPRLGLTGAAISTLIGRGSGVLLQFWLLNNGSSRVRILWRDLRLVPEVFLSLARVSVTGILQFALGHTSWIALVRLISTFGADAVAGYTIGIRIFMFAVLPSWGLSGAAATMVGQNLGAGKPERGAKAVYLTAGYNLVYLGLVSLVFIFAPELIVRVFSSGGEVSRDALDCLRIIGYGNLVYAVGMVMVQAFNGAGDTVTPTLINVIGYWGCEIPIAWVLSHRAGWGLKGVFWSIPIANALITLLGVIMFLRGGWKKRRI